MPPLEFQLNLTGTFAAALAPVNKGLGEADEKLKKTGKEAKLFETDITGLKTSLGGLEFNLGALKGKGSFFTFDIAAGISAAIGAVRALGSVISDVAGKLWDLGKAIVKTAAETQDLNLAVRLTAGAEMGAEVDRLAASFGNTRLGAQGVKQLLLPFLDQGVRDRQLLDDMLTAASDEAVRTGEGTAGIKNKLDVFRSILLKGQIEEETFKNLGIVKTDFLADLGSRLGRTQGQVKELLGKSKVSSDVLIDTVLGQIAKRQGGALGVATLESAKTLGGTLERLSNLPANIFRRIADSEGMSAVQGVLDNIVKVLGGEGSTRLMEHLDTVFKTIFSDFAGEDGAKKMEELFTSIVDWIGKMVKGFREAWPEIVEGARALWEVAKGIMAAFKWVFDIGAGPLIERALLQREETAKMQALLLGLQQRNAAASLAPGAKEAAYEGGMSVGNAFSEGAKDALQSRSPSRVFMRLGEGSAEGFAVGMEQGGSRVESAARRTLYEVALGAGPGRAESTAPAPVASPSVAVEVTVYTQASDAAGVGQEVGQAVRTELRKALDEIGYGLAA